MIDSIYKLVIIYINILLFKERKNECNIKW